MFNFSQAASKTLSSCALMTGRQKVTTDTILLDHPQYITITGFDFASSTQGEYAVVELAEYPNKYYPCGMSITNICRVWIESFDGDLDAANKELKEAGGCRVQLERVRTSKGNKFIRVTVL